MARPPEKLKDDQNCPACGAPPESLNEGHPVWSKKNVKVTPPTFELHYTCVRCKAFWKAGEV